MRFLLINNEFPPIGGGGSTVTKYLLRYLTEWGHEVTLVTSSFRGLPRREVVEGATVIRVPAVRRYKDFCATWELALFGLSALGYLLWRLPKVRPDVTLALFALPAGLVARVLHLIFGAPYIVYFGGSDMPGANPSRYRALYPFLTPLIRWVWRGAPVSIVCSERLLKFGRRLDPKVDFRMIPMGVELVRFQPVERPANPKVRVLFIGRLIPRKGLQYVIRALPRVRELTDVPFEVEVVGTGAMREALDGLAERMSVSHLLRYVGTVPYDKLHESYQGADIFVLTSMSEGMPAVVLEAMACGLPVIATDVSGNEELVRRGENGFLVPVEDTEALAQALVKLIRDKDLRERMGMRSRQLVQPHEWRDIVKRYEMILKEVVHGSLR